MSLACHYWENVKCNINESGEQEKNIKKQQQQKQTTKTTRQTQQQSKERCKDQELIQSSTTPDPGYQWESDKLTEDTPNRAKRLALSQQVTTKHI